MKVWKSSPAPDFSENETKIHVTQTYLEIEARIDDKTAIVFYYIPRNSSSMYIATCWGSIFDNLLKYDEKRWGVAQINFSTPNPDEPEPKRYDPRSTRRDTKVSFSFFVVFVSFVENLCFWCKNFTGKILVKLYQNGTIGKFSEGALVRLEDNDSGDKKWFIATVVGNINLDDSELLSDERIAKATDLIIGKSIAIYRELETRNPSSEDSWQSLTIIGQGLFNLIVKQIRETREH